MQPEDVAALLASLTSCDEPSTRVPLSLGVVAPPLWRLVAECLGEPSWDAVLARLIHEEPTPDAPQGFVRLQPALRGATTAAADSLRRVGMDPADLVCTHVALLPGEAKPNSLPDQWLRALVRHERDTMRPDLPSFLRAHRALDLNRVFEGWWRARTGQHDQQRRPLSRHPPEPNGYGPFDRPDNVAVSQGYAVLQYENAVAIIDLATGSFELLPARLGQPLASDGHVWFWANGLELASLDVADRRFVDGEIPTYGFWDDCCEIAMWSADAGHLARAPCADHGANLGVEVSPCGRFAWRPDAPEADERTVFDAHTFERVPVTWPRAVREHPTVQSVHERVREHNIDTATCALVRVNDGFRWFYGGMCFDEAGLLSTHDGVIAAAFDVSGDTLVCLHDESLTVVGGQTYDLSALHAHLRGPNVPFAYEAMAVTGTVKALAEADAESLAMRMQESHRTADVNGEVRHATLSELQRLIGQARQTNLSDRLDAIR